MGRTFLLICSFLLLISQCYGKPMAKPPVHSAKITNALSNNRMVIPDDRKYQVIMEELAALHKELANKEERIEILELKAHETKASNTVYFSAYFTADVDIDSGVVFTFDTVSENEGNGYDPSTGDFTCPATGLYVFSASLWATNDRRAEGVLEINDAPRATLFSADNYAVQGGLSITTVCTQGDKVHLRCGGTKGEKCRIHDSDTFHAINIFSGGLIQLL